MGAVFGPDRELDAFLAGVIDAGKADYVSSHFTTGIVAPVFGMVVDALEAERLHRGQAGSSGT